MAVSGVINTNLGALFAQNALNNTTSALNNAIQQLSTGKKINSPADNPAGYAISQRFTTQINGLNQAISNSNQAVSLVQTATGAIQQETNILQKIRTIAVQAANGSNSTQDRQSLQNVVSQLTAQVNTIAQQTQFNGQNLLDGTFSGEQFQVGANANQILNVSISNAQASAIGVNQTSAGSLFSGSTGSVLSGLAFTGTTSGGGFSTGSVKIAGSKGTGSFKVSSATESAASLASSINDITQTTNVSASADTKVALGVNFSGSSISFTLGNGTTSSSGQTNGVNITATSLDGLVSAINNNTATTGITATKDANGNLVLQQTSGKNVSITNFTGSGGANLSAVAAGGTGTKITSGSSANTGLFQGLVSLQSTDGFAISSGASNIGVQNTSTLNSVSKVDVSTIAGANKAISTIDFAISALNQQGGQLGAIQQRVQSLTSNLQTAATNLTSARSTVQDANVAKVTSQLTRAQILQQAGISTLAQANALQQGYLKLLP